jgi:hypothetical protein
VACVVGVSCVRFWGRTALVYAAAEGRAPVSRQTTTHVMCDAEKSLRLPCMMLKASVTRRCWGEGRGGGACMSE